MADTIELDPGTGGAIVSTEEVTTLNGGAVSAQHVTRMLLAYRVSDGVSADLTGDTTNGLDVDVTRLPSLPAGTNAIGKLAANSGVDIGDVDVTSSALPTGAATSAKQPALGTAGTASADVISVQGIASMTALKTDGSGVTQPVSDAGGSLTVDNGGTFAVQIAANSSVNNAQVAGTATSVNSGTKDAGTQRVILASDQTVVPISDNAGSLTVDAPVGTPAFVRLSDGSAAITTLPVSLATLPALTAGTAAIGKLSANSGVDIGDVDVTSISAGTNAIGNVGIVPRTTGGLTTYHLASAGSTNATNVKASAGQLFGWYVHNSHATLSRKLVLHNTAGTPTAGASVFFSIVVPPNSSANVFSETGIAFGTGIGITTVTGLADSDTTAVAANDLIINLFYA